MPSAPCPGPIPPDADPSTIAVESTAFFLDVDGTLLGFKDRPSDVVADADLLDLLTRLHAAAGGAVALVSGRSVADLDRIVAPLVLPSAGLHGADLRFADGARRLADAAIIDPVRPDIVAFALDRPGLLLEDKGATLAVHYRHAPEWEAEVTRFLVSLAAGRGLAVQEGKLVAELKPAVCNKGEAIFALMKTAPFAGRRPLFVGDDKTDEHGFAAVNTLGGVSIKVTVEGGATEAAFALRDPQAVRAFLSTLYRKAQ